MCISNVGFGSKTDIAANVANGWKALGFAVALDTFYLGCPSLEQKAYHSAAAVGHVWKVTAVYDPPALPSF
jgi:hypothetical protein